MNIEKFTMKTPDGIHANVEALKALFPEIVSEGKIDFEQLKTILGGEIADDERYQFTWAGKREAMLEASTPTTKTLRPCREESKDWENTKNLYIEGDNLEALKILQNTYGGKVKMIYIDPPYNTGHDFIYHDNFHGTRQEELIKEGVVDEETGERFKMNSESNGRFHSDWCSMMYPRLKLARNLLRDDGVLFMSIDDNEVVNARKLCDTIFGELNFIAQITVVSNPRGRDYGGVAKMHEYVFVYRRSDVLSLSLIKDDTCQFSMSDKNGGFELRELRNRNVKFNKENRPNLYYPFYINTDNEDNNGLYEIDLEPHEGWMELYPLPSQGINVVWRWGKEKSARNLNSEIKAKKMKNGGFMIVEKYRESRKMARSVWWDKESNTERGTLEVKELFYDKKVFDYPKPIAMLERMVEMATGEEFEGLVLDFFSGSAATAHAVMKLNAEDGGNRKFIMVQLPEVCAEGSEAAKAGYKNICEIGKERIRRAGEKIREELVSKDAKSAKSGETLFGQDLHDLQDGGNLVNPVNPVKTNLDIGFRVFKVDSSNMDDIYFQPMNVQQEDLIRAINNVKTDRTALDLLFGCLLEWGLPIDLPVKERKDLGSNTFEVDNGRIIAAFDSNIAESTVRSIANEQPDFAIFRDQCFYDSASKINVGEIFKTLSPNTKLKVL